MKVAIMQPYFLPYIGYYQLVAAVDRFVILDDVNYIKQGWINRNTLVLDGRPHWMTVPLRSASPNDLIRTLEIAPDNGWKKKLKRTVEQAYTKAPAADEMTHMFHEMIDRAGGNLSDFLRWTIGEICQRLGIETRILPNSGVCAKGESKGQARIIQICKELGANTYINLPGGRNLYRSEDFKSEGISLLFIEPDIPTGQIRSGLDESLHVSILDLLMRNPLETIRSALPRIELSQ